VNLPIIAKRGGSREWAYEFDFLVIGEKISMAGKG
jgi:hypothetical protein